MKLTKSNIFALMTLGGLLAFGQVAGAQDQSTTNTPPAGGRGGRPNMDRVMQQLKLTDDQKEKVKPILKDEADKMKALRDDTSLSAQEKRPKMREIRDDTAAKLKPILSEDQFAQWQKMTQPRGRRGGTPPPSTNAPAAPQSSDSK